MQLRTLTNARPASHARVGATVRPTVSIRRVQLRAAAAEVESKAQKKEQEEEEDYDDGPEIIPSTQEIEGLLTTLVQDTEIAELKLKMGGFELKVRRSTQSTASSAAAAPPAFLPPSLPRIDAQPSMLPVQSSMDEVLAATESIDESLMYVESPKVGIFRRGKGKGKVKPVFNVNDSVKKGQTLGFVEQLGTFVDIKAPSGGEIVRFLIEDGAPVEYQQHVVELAPAFGGHSYVDPKIEA